MKVFILLLFSVIFVVLITSYTPSIAVDEPDDITEDTKYKIYLHVVVRNGHGELVTVTDLIPCKSKIGCS